MRIPFEVSAIGMKSSDETRNDAIVFILVGIRGFLLSVFSALSLFLSEFGIISDSVDGVARSDEEQIKETAVSDEIVSELLRNGEHHMAMLAVEGSFGKLDGSHSGFFDSA